MDHSQGPFQDVDEHETARAFDPASILIRSKRTLAISRYQSQYEFHTNSYRLPRAGLVESIGLEATP